MPIEDRLAKDMGMGANDITAPQEHERDEDATTLGMAAEAIVTKLSGKDRTTVSSGDPAKSSIRRTMTGGPDIVLHAGLRASDADGVGAPSRE